MVTFERDMPLLRPLAPRGRLLGVTPAVPQVAMLHRESGMPAPDKRGPAVEGRGGCTGLSVAGVGGAPGQSSGKGLASQGRQGPQAGLPG